MRIVVVIASAVLAACDVGPLPHVDSQQTRRAQERARIEAFSRYPYPLDEAIVADRIEDARQLLANGADPNKRWNGGDRFPLQEVLEAGGRHRSARSEFVRLLLRYGADVNAQWCPGGSRDPWHGMPRCTTSTGYSPLTFAAIVGDREVVEVLLHAGADPWHETWTQGTPLDYARDDVVFELLSRKMFPDIDTRDQKSLAWLGRHRGETSQSSKPPTLLSSALWPHGAERFAPAANRVRTLLRIGADPNERFALDQTHLSRALAFRQLGAARALLEGGADVNARWCESDLRRRDPACTIDTGVTPLMCAAEQGSLPAVQLLLEFKADKSLKDWAGRTAAHYATTREIWDVTLVRK